MGRPRKDDPRKHQLNVRFTAAEFVRIHQHAALDGKSLPEFSRAALLRRPRKRRSPRTPTLIAFAPPVLEAWQRLGVQLNQIAHCMNAREELPPIALARVLVELRRLLRSGVRQLPDRYALAPAVRFHLRKVGANLVQLRQRHEDLGLAVPAALLRLLEHIRRILRGDQPPDAA